MRRFSLVALAILGCGSSSPAGDNDGTMTIASAWGCLDHPATPVSRAPGPVTYLVPIVDFNSKPSFALPVQGLDVRVCGDDTCDTPAPDVTVEPAPGLPKGVYAITFPFAFEHASLRLSADGYVSVDYVFGGPMIGTQQGDLVMRGFAIRMLRIERMSALYSMLGIPIDPARGTVLLRAVDCADKWARDVTIDSPSGVSENGALWWSLDSNNVPTRDSMTTPDSGLIGIANVEPASLVAHGTPPRAAVGTTYGSTTISVRPGVMSMAEIRVGIDQWGQ